MGCSRDESQLVTGVSTKFGLGCLAWKIPKINNIDVFLAEFEEFHFPNQEEI